MKIIIKPRQSGKTTKLIKMSAKSGACIVCRTEHEVQALFHMAKNDGINIPKPISYAAFVGSRYVGKNINAFLIDNVDLLLEHISLIRIEAITLTKEK